MNKETKSNIKIAVIAIVIMGAVFGGLYINKQNHEAEHAKPGSSHQH